MPSSRPSRSRSRSWRSHNPMIPSLVCCCCCLVLSFFPSCFLRRPRAFYPQYVVVSPSSFFEIKNYAMCLQDRKKTTLSKCLSRPIPRNRRGGTWMGNRYQAHNAHTPKPPKHNQLGKNNPMLEGWWESKRWEIKIKNKIWMPKTETLARLLDFISYSWWMMMMMLRFNQWWDEVRKWYAGP